jgi:hypothetical protein
MPKGVVLHVWAPGDRALELPDDTALQLPADSRRLVVQAHVLWFEDSSGENAQVALELTPTPPKNIAGWLGTLAAVPPIPPHSGEQAESLCHVAAPLHIMSTWPHMHRVGRSFHGDILRSDGTKDVLVDLPTWNYDHQLTYDTSADLAAGDGVRTVCTWQNDGDSYVFPGLRSTDEMCGQGLVVWPVSNAGWSNGCPEN